MQRIIVLLICVFTLLQGVSAHVHQKQEDNIPKVSVNGEATVMALPDKAIVRFAIATLADNPREARKQNAKTAKEVVRAVKRIIKNEKQMQMEVLRINEKHEYDARKKRSIVIGFEAYREFVVELHNVDNLSELVATVVDHGSNKLLGVEFGLQDEHDIRAEALEKAVMDARHKADVMLKALDAKRGPVIDIHEQYFERPRPMIHRTAFAAAGSEAESFAEGEIKFKVSVRVAFAID